MTIAEAAAEIDALKEQLASTKAQLRFVQDLNDDLVRIISDLERQR